MRIFMRVTFGAPRAVMKCATSTLKHPRAEVARLLRSIILVSIPPCRTLPLLTIAACLLLVISSVSVMLEKAAANKNLSILFDFDGTVGDTETPAMEVAFWELAPYLVNTRECRPFVSLLPNESVVHTWTRYVGPFIRRELLPRDTNPSTISISHVPILYALQFFNTHFRSRFSRAKSLSSQL